MGKVIELKESGQKISMNCPSVKSVKLALKIEDDMEKVIALISATCNLTPDEVDALPFPDYMVLQEAVNGFLDVSDKPAPKATR